MIAERNPRAGISAFAVLKSITEREDSEAGREEIPMYGQLFTLVTVEDDSKIFAWGIEIATEDDLEAVIYRKDPATARTLFGLHDSAQAACERWSSVVKLRIRWEESYLPSATSDSATSTSCESSSGNRPLTFV
jgi:hypothetical protein